MVGGVGLMGTRETRQKRQVESTVLELRYVDGYTGGGQAVSLICNLGSSGMLYLLHCHLDAVARGFILIRL